MEVKATQVKAVYVAASRLKMERAVNYCAQYLVDHLDPATAIEIRALPGIQRKPELAARVDSFLAAEVTSIFSPTLYSLNLT
jgi:influenza virus NS1A-binding protein